MAAGFSRQRRLGSKTQTSAVLPTPDSHRTGFVYVREGAIALGEHTIAARQVAVLGDGATLEPTASDTDADFLVGTGAPLDEPWTKLLGHNGFVIASDEAEADALLQAYEARGPAFGQLP